MFTTCLAATLFAHMRNLAYFLTRNILLQSSVVILMRYCLAADRIRLQRSCGKVIDASHILKPVAQINNIEY